MKKRILSLEKGEQFFENGFNIFVNRVSEKFDTPQHEHDFIEICYVWSGSGFHYIDNETVRVSQGELFFLPIGVSHIFRPSAADAKEPLIIINCIFEEDMLQTLAALFPAAYRLSNVQAAITEPGHWLHLRETAGEFSRVFEALIAEYDSKRPGFEIMLLGLLLQLLISIERMLVPELAAGKQGIVVDIPAQRAERALHHIRENLHDKLTLTAVARHIGIGERQLQRILATSIGLSFSTLLCKERIDHSKRLLTDPSLASITVADIASRSGIRDLKSFYRLFKAATGVTPAQYRARGR